MGPFATAGELYDRIGEPAPADLSRAQEFLDDASSLIRSTMGQVFSVVANETITLESSPTNVLYLPETPVTGITSVTENGTLLSSTLYSFVSTGALKRWSSSTHQVGVAWTYGATVVYTHGYAETTAEFGTLRTIAIEVAMRALQGPGGQAENFGMVVPTTVGFSPSIFLTENELSRLANLGGVPVG